MTRTRIALALATALLPLAAQADDAAQCGAVRLFDPGWTDINATNAVATTLLSALGYAPEVKTLSVIVGYEAMKAGEIDAFLGNWMPAQQKFIDDLNATKAVEVLGQNLEGAKFTLAVTSAAGQMGVKDFKDLAPLGEAFDRKIYGIEAGAPANESIQKMIGANDFGLGDWELVASSEQGMLAQVARGQDSDAPVVFLAWAPHPMNTRFDLTYLAGGDAYFGPDYGGADVYTLARSGWSGACPNAAQLLRNLVFTIEAESTIMGGILDDGQTPDESAKAWLKANPATLERWLTGVTTLDGAPALPAAQAALGL